jgi:hypothetical protein
MFTLRLSKKYGESRVLALQKEGMKLGVDPDVDAAMARYGWEFTGRLTSDGRLYLTYSEPRTFSVRAKDIAATQLHFVLYHFVKTAVYEYLSEQDTTFYRIPYKRSFTVLTANPEEATRQNFSQLIEVAVGMRMAGLRDALTKLCGEVDTRWKQYLLPLRAVFTGRSLDLANEINLWMDVVRRSRAKLSLFSLPLRALKYPIEAEFSREYDTRQVQTISETSAYVLSRFDSMSSMVGIWLALVGIGASALQLLALPIGTKVQYNATSPLVSTSSILFFPWIALAVVVGSVAFYATVGFRHPQMLHERLVHTKEVVEEVQKFMGEE